MRDKTMGNQENNQKLKFPQYLSKMPDNLVVSEGMQWWLCLYFQDSS